MRWLWLVGLLLAVAAHGHGMRHASEVSALVDAQARAILSDLKTAVGQAVEIVQDAQKKASAAAAEADKEEILSAGNSEALGVLAPFFAEVNAWNAPCPPEGEDIPVSDAQFALALQIAELTSVLTKFKRQAGGSDDANALLDALQSDATLSREECLQLRQKTAQLTEEEAAAIAEAEEEMLTEDAEETSSAPPAFSLLEISSGTQPQQQHPLRKRIAKGANTPLVPSAAVSTVPFQQHGVFAELSAKSRLRVLALVSTVVVGLASPFVVSTYSYVTKPQPGFTYQTDLNCGVAAVAIPNSQRLCLKPLNQGDCSELFHEGRLPNLQAGSHSYCVRTKSSWMPWHTPLYYSHYDPVRHRANWVAFKLHRSTTLKPGVHGGDRKSSWWTSAPGIHNPQPTGLSPARDWKCNATLVANLRELYLNISQNDVTAAVAFTNTTCDYLKTREKTRFRNHIFQPIRACLQNGALFRQASNSFEPLNVNGREAAVILAALNTAGLNTLSFPTRLGGAVSVQAALNTLFDAFEKPPVLYNQDFSKGHMMAYSMATGRPTPVGIATFNMLNVAVNYADFDGTVWGTKVETAIKDHVHSPDAGRSVWVIVGTNGTVDSTSFARAGAPLQTDTYDHPAVMWALLYDPANGQAQNRRRMWECTQSNVNARSCTPCDEVQEAQIDTRIAAYNIGL